MARIISNVENLAVFINDDGKLGSNYEKQLHVTALYLI